MLYFHTFSADVYNIDMTYSCHFFIFLWQQYVRTYVCMYVRTHACVYVYMYYLYMYVCVKTYVLFEKFVHYSDLF
jgi:hypothetical protein